jgi:hypothetical protein
VRAGARTHVHAFSCLWSVEVALWANVHDTDAVMGTAVVSTVG